MVVARDLAYSDMHDPSCGLAPVIVSVQVGQSEPETSVEHCFYSALVPNDLSSVATEQCLNICGHTAMPLCRM